LRVLGGIFDTDILSAKLDNLKLKTEKEDFWSNPNIAKNIMREISELEEQLNLVDEINEGLNDISEFYEIAVEENDNDSILEY
jgi:protein subunit release factor A